MQIFNFNVSGKHEDNLCQSTISAELKNHLLAGGVNNYGYDKIRGLSFVRVSLAKKFPILLIAGRYLQFLDGFC
jgi:hypothetical protein